MIRSNLLRGLASASLVTLAGVWACGSDTEEGSTSGQGGSASTTSSGGGKSCTVRCANKLTACDAAPDSIDPACATFCVQTPSDDRLECFESSPCSVVANPDVCVDVETSTGSGGGMGGGPVVTAGPGSGVGAGGPLGPICEELLACCYSRNFPARQVQDCDQYARQSTEIMCETKLDALVNDGTCD